MLLILMGLKQVNSTYIPLYAGATLMIRTGKMNLTVNVVMNVALTVRTMKALMSTEPTPEQEDQRKGWLNALLICISLTNVVPDELHLS